MNHEPDFSGSRRTETLELLTIGEVSTKYEVTLRALRFYESRGLIAPRRIGAVRLYDPRDTRRLELILKGKQLGFTLSEIRDMLVAETGADFTVQGLPIASDSAVIEAGVDLALGAGASLDLSYAGIIAADASSHAVKLTGAVNF